MKVILIVEDEDAKAAAMRRLCKSMGFDTARCSDMATARVLLTSELGVLCIGAVITDWCFPRDVVQAHRGATVGMGREVVEICAEHNMPCTVFSGMMPEAPVPWINSSDIGALKLWLNDVAHKI